MQAALHLIRTCIFPHQGALVLNLGQDHLSVDQVFGSRRLDHSFHALDWQVIDWPRHLIPSHRQLRIHCNVKPRRGC